MKTYSKAAFETAIVDHLLTHGGYGKGNPDTFDRRHALDSGVLLSFVKETQPKGWEYLTGIWVTRQRRPSLKNSAGRSTHK